jgi:ClpP class serine protease
VHTSGRDKGALDPFQPERPDDVARLKELQRSVHEVFIGIVKERRGAKLTGPEEEMFSGSFWSASKAVDYGLIDGVADLRSKMQELHGRKVRLRAVPMAPGGLLTRLRRLPGLWTEMDNGFTLPLPLPDELLSAIEVRALWSRFGL